MKESQYILDEYSGDQTYIFKDVIAKYLKHWPWFLLAIVLCVLAGYLYMRYAPVSYVTEAKVKILDDSKELEIAMDPLSLLEGKSQINLENEIEILSSYRILSQVVKELDLDIRYYEVGNIKSTELWNPPFRVRKQFPPESLQKQVVFSVEMNDDEMVVRDEEGEVASFNESSEITIKSLPVTIERIDSLDLHMYQSSKFKVVLLPQKEAVLQLSKDLKVEATSKKSEILALSLTGESAAKNEAILNTTIGIFDADGILDRQLVSKRTVDFIDDRFIFLSGELDSIEGNKEDFKQENRLSDIQADTEITLQKKTRAEQEVFNIETQISLSQLLKETLMNESDYSLLPADIGLENNSINSLVREYNKKVLERDRLISSAGANNPTLQLLSDQLQRTRQNIMQTVNMNLQKLKVSRSQLNMQKYEAGSTFSSLPEKEKMLRAIERQQSIKENLFILLLQKREEAAINLAVTAPTIKIVDYGLTNSEPVSPDGKVVYGVSLACGLLFPFLILFVRFSLDTKIHNKAEVEKLAPSIPVLAEIPFFENGKIFRDGEDHTLLAESFRILSTNVNYLLPNNNISEGSKVIYITSAIKEEGKTLIAINLSLAYANIKKRVLLIGADLRNPKLHTFFGVDKNVTGLSNYLYDPETNWEDCIREGYEENPYHKVCLSGMIPPNAPKLLSGDAFEKFIDKAKMKFDYIIVDTAPTLLVTDTFLISQFAEATLFIVRAGFTDKRLLEFSKDLKKQQKLKNPAYVVNGIDTSLYKGYNYGYTYGYSDQPVTRNWFQRLFNKN